METKLTLQEISKIGSSDLPKTEHSTPYLEKYLEHVDGSLIELSEGMGFYGVPIYRIRIFKGNKISENDVYLRKSARDSYLNTIIKK